MTGTMKTFGSKAEVFHGTAVKTTGQLHKHHLIRNRKGRIVSKKKHAAGKKAIKRLFALGFKPQKGKFSLMRKGTTKSTAKGKKSSRRTRKRGGADMMGSVSQMMGASMEQFENKP